MSKIVGRTLDFLEIFANQKRPLSLSEISRLLHIPASSCHDVVQALQKRGYIYELGPREGYYPTLRIYKIAKTISDCDPVILRANIVLQRLRDTLDETVLLAKVGGLNATYLLIFESSHPLRFLRRIGDNIKTLHANSAGKALLGSLSAPALAAYLKSAKLSAATPRTITSKRALRDEIAVGNKRGWFTNREESLEGVTTISARFVWMSGVYIVTIAGPTSRIEPTLDKAAGMLTAVCKRLEMQPGSGS